MGRLGTHPHVVSVFDLGQHEGQPYLATELMGGGDVEGCWSQQLGHQHKVGQRSLIYPRAVGADGPVFEARSSRRPSCIRLIVCTGARDSNGGRPEPAPVWVLA